MIGTEQIPSCETYISNMFTLTLIPQVKHKYLKIIPISIDIIICSAVFCPLFYDNYYPLNSILYSTDLAIASIVYTYLSYKYLNWEDNSCFEHTSIDRFSENVTLGFYNLFMIYWFYESVLAFILHNQNNIFIQIGNIYMAFAWYFYFTICALLYYFICIKLAQRTHSINAWLKSLKATRPSIDEFYRTYKIHRRAIKKFGRHWNFIIFMGFIILTYHIPVDLVNIIYNNRYTDSAGVIVKSLGLGWYVYQICQLNNQDTRVISYLYKHGLYTIEEMAVIERYAKYHELGLNFYGIKIDGTIIIKGSLVTINLIIPTIYAIVTNKLFGVGQ